LSYERTLSQTNAARVDRPSIAFHTALGFAATELPDYAGRGETRTVFWRQPRG